MHTTRRTPCTSSSPRSTMCGAQESTTHNHIYLCPTESSKSASQPEQLQGSETSSETHHQCPGPQPKPGALGPTVSARLEEHGDHSTGAMPARGREHRCGVCGHLLLAVVLTVFSPLIAVGICLTDVVTGCCCNVCPIDSVDDP